MGHQRSFPPAARAVGREIKTQAVRDSAGDWSALCVLIGGSEMHGLGPLRAEDGLAERRVLEAATSPSRYRQASLSSGRPSGPRGVTGPQPRQVRIGDGVSS